MKLSFSSKFFLSAILGCIYFCYPVAELLAQSLIIKDINLEKEPLRADIVMAGEQAYNITANIQKISDGKYRFSVLSRNDFKTPFFALIVAVSAGSTTVFPFEITDESEVSSSDNLKNSIEKLNVDIQNSQAELDKLNRKYEILKTDARLIGDIGEIEILNTVAQELQFELSSLNTERQIRQKNISESFTLESDPYIGLQLDEVQKELIQLRKQVGIKPEVTAADSQDFTESLIRELEELKLQRRMLEERISERNY